MVKTLIGFDNLNKSLGNALII